MNADLTAESKKSKCLLLTGTLTLAVGVLIWQILFPQRVYSPTQRAWASLRVSTEAEAREKHGQPISEHTEHDGVRVLVYEAENGVYIAMSFDPETGEILGGGKADPP